MFDAKSVNPLVGLYDFIKGYSFDEFKARLPDVLKLFPRKLATSALCDKVKTSVLIVDPQKDFAQRGGALYVEGAQEDMERALKLLCSIVGTVSKLYISADKHHDGAIFFPERHLMPDGNHPKVFSAVSADDYLYNHWHSNPKFGNQAERDKRIIHYCREAAKEGVSLTIWPHHCMHNSDGEKFVDQISIFRKIFNEYRKSTAQIISKGADFDTEYYSAFGPVVKTGYDGQPLSSMPAVSPSSFSNDDIIIVMGEALSHCVGETLSDLIDAGLGDRIYLVRDCTSSVTGFEKQGESFVKLLKYNGGHVVQSTTPFLKWPGVREIFEENNLQARKSEKPSVIGRDRV